MSESELIEATTSYYELVVAMIGLYMTFTSGFLIVAYMVGSKLSRSQIGIISSLFLFMATISAYGSYSWMQRAALYGAEQADLVGIQTYLTTAGPVVLALVMVFGIIASLKFMWDVRHPKS